MNMGWGTRLAVIGVIAGAMLWQWTIKHSKNALVRDVVVEPHAPSLSQAEVFRGNVVAWCDSSTIQEVTFKLETAAQGLFEVSQIHPVIRLMNGKLIQFECGKQGKPVMKVIHDQNLNAAASSMTKISQTANGYIGIDRSGRILRSKDLINWEEVEGLKGQRFLDFASYENISPDNLAAYY